MTKESKIVFRFNMALFAFFCVNELMTLFFEPENEDRVPWDAFYDVSPILSVIVAILIVLLMLIWGAKLIQLFWNRFISDVFKLRTICFQEALSIALIMALFLTSSYV